MITGAFTTEEKDRCQKFLDTKYTTDQFTAHMTPKGYWIDVEVILTDGDRKHHRLKRKECGTYEEVEMPGNDR